MLVRLLARDGGAQVAIAEDFVREGVWVSTLVLAEAIWVLGDIYKTSSQQLANLVETLLDNAYLSIQDADAVAASLRQFRETPSLRFSDCLTLELARKAGHLPLATFDRNFAKLDGAQKL